MDNNKTQNLVEMIEFSQNMAVRHERERIIKAINMNEPLHWEIGETGYNMLMRIINDTHKSL